MALDPESEAYYEAVKNMEILKGMVKLKDDLDQIQVTIKKLNEIVGLS